MNKQTFQISIPQPCHEKWEEMTAVEKERFCGSCQKVVTDFTQMEDVEIIQFLKEGKGLCGRFSAAQLDRPLIPALEPPRYFVVPFYKKIAASLLIMAAFAEKTFAQQKKQSITQQQVAKIKSKSTNFFSIEGRINKVLELSNYPQSGLSIYLRINTFAILSKTDSNGRFIFKVPNKYLNRSAIIGSDEYNQQTVVLMERMESVQLKNVQVMKVANASMGAFVGGPYWDRNEPRLTLEGVKVTRKQSFWYRITHPFKRRTKK